MRMFRPTKFVVTPHDIDMARQLNRDLLERLQGQGFNESFFCVFSKKDTPTFDSPETLALLSLLKEV